MTQIDVSFWYFISEQLKYHYLRKDLFNTLKQKSSSQSSLLCHKMDYNNSSSSKMSVIHISTNKVRKFLLSLTNLCISQ